MTRDEAEKLLADLKSAMRDMQSATGRFTPFDKLNALAVRDGMDAVTQAYEAIITALTRPAPQPSEGGVELVDELIGAVRGDSADWISGGSSKAARAEVAAARATLLARLAATKGAVPEGWQLVPKVPNEAMLIEGARVNRDFYTKDGPYPRTKAMYAAMLDAAPAPEVTK